MRWFELIPGLRHRDIKSKGIYETPPEAHLDTLRKQHPMEKASPAMKSLPVPEGVSLDAPVLGLRVDVDTHGGMRDGVPRLLDALREAGVRATFYLAMGPDRSGKAIFNLLRPGFLKKMRRTSAGKVYGWRTLLSGTLLPARPVASGFPETARRIAAEGHEAGIHSWSHRDWQDRLPKYSPERIVLDLDAACEAFQGIFGVRPETTAAPAWLCSEESLQCQEPFHFLYASDCRGMDPFLPNIERRTLKTPQVPVTLPTLDEALGDSASDAASFFRGVLDQVKAGEWPVLTVHAELEGGPFVLEFADFLREARGRGIQVVSLRNLLSLRVSTGKTLPRCTMSWGEIEGRSGVVSMQMLEV
jgi:undecaprenyl phosphate-alpha-L-ara4FN deformylase